MNPKPTPPCATEPAQVDLWLARAFNAGDLEAAAALYEPGAATLGLPHEGAALIEGRAAIKESLGRGLFRVRGHMELVVRHVLRSGDLALLRSSWRVRGHLPGGETVNIQHQGVEVVRRQTDGRWQFALDHPFAADPCPDDFAPVHRPAPGRGPGASTEFPSRPGASVDLTSPHV